MSDRRESSRRSRSRTYRDEDTPRERRSRSRSRTRNLHGSRRRSRSLSSSRSLRQRERKLSLEKERLMLLESEVCRERERLNERSRTHQKSVTPTTHHLRSDRNRSPATTKRHLPDTDDNEPVPKSPRPTVELFEEFLNAFKARAGDRETFSNSAFNNVIPEFDPMLKEQTINNWLDKVDECSEIYNWSEKQTVHYALPKLTGLAKTWYQGLPSIKHTWGEWKAMLRESFPATENYAELLTEMLNRRVRPGESFELYYFTKINLLNRCKRFGKQAVDFT